ncbi:MAG: hypothetical protein KKA62_01405, partial [Nanoarchaeota archaeon]|nr:hypothetical protein [Nanoarchaeota archaeon]MBU1644303.1 hypothetical protein [Nanoarchaeota archaeon]MBU1976590.1 hypothetical protein [Nanoarchaeota archaeon]
LVGVDSEYNAKFVGSLPTQLLSGQQESLTLQIDVPKDEDGGKHSIGLVKFTGKNENNEVITKEVGIYVQPKSYLLVDNIEVNGKSSGDLVMDDTNEIEFTITNDYDEDMDVSEIRVRLLDADGDEILDQEVDLEDKDMIKDGEEEDYSVELDLNGEKLSDEEYTLEITVEGEADDNTNHKTVETKTVGVDRKSHQVIISSAALTSSKLICSEYTTLHVTVENVGKNTEDDVEIRVKNSALNLDLKKTGIELEDYSSNDNDYKATFSLNVADAKAGTYTLDVELYRDGDLEETKKVELVIVGCSATESEEETVNDYSKLAAELQQKLNGYVDEKETTTVKGSFRESSTYTTLLGILVVLVFVAAVLSLALLFTKRR